MPTEVIMPKVDMDMETGTLSVWHIAEGEAVTKGAPLFDIETDKAAMEVESPATGRLRTVLVAPGQTVAVGSPVAWIYAEGEAVLDTPAPAPHPGTPDAAPETAPETATDATRHQPPPQSADRPADPAASNTPRDPRATPLARRLAREAGLPLASLSGTGPRNRIQRLDVETALALHPRAPEPAPAPQGLHPAPAAPAAQALEPAPKPAPDALTISRRNGEGTPLLLIHGFAADSFGWAPLERELPPNLPLIRIDLPSHGRSTHQSIPDFDGLVTAVTRAFDSLDAGPVHVLGHSLGGGVALALADLRPRQIASLTLIAPAGLGPEINGAALAGIARASRVESLAPWLKRLTATPDAISWDFAKAAMLSRNDPALRAAQTDLADRLFPDGVQSFDLTAALARVTAPATVIWGRRDHILPWKQALDIPGHIALHLLKEIGHIPHIECPGAIAAILSRTLRHPLQS